MAFTNRLSLVPKWGKSRLTDLGKVIGTSGDIIRKYERGENIPSIEMVIKIAKALGVPMDDLVKNEVSEYYQ